MKAAGLQLAAFFFLVVGLIFSLLANEQWWVALIIWAILFSTSAIVSAIDRKAGP